MCGVFFVVVFFCVVFFRAVFFVLYQNHFALFDSFFFHLFWKMFGHTLKKKVFLWVVKLGLIQYLEIFLCLFRNYLIVSKFNFLLFFLLFWVMFSLHEWYCPVRFSIVFHSHHHFIINLFPIIHNIDSPSPVSPQSYQQVKWTWWVWFLN